MFGVCAVDLSYSSGHVYPSDGGIYHLRGDCGISKLSCGHPHFSSRTEWSMKMARRKKPVDPNAPKRVRKSKKTAPLTVVEIPSTVEEVARPPEVIHTYDDGAVLLGTGEVVLPVVPEMGVPISRAEKIEILDRMVATEDIEEVDIHQADREDEEVFERMTEEELIAGLEAQGLIPVQTQAEVTAVLEEVRNRDTALADMNWELSQLKSTIPGKFYAAAWLEAFREEYKNIIKKYRDRIARG